MARQRGISRGFYALMGAWTGRRIYLRLQAEERMRFALLCDMLDRQRASVFAQRCQETVRMPFEAMDVQVEAGIVQMICLKDEEAYARGVELMEEARKAIGFPEGSLWLKPKADAPFIPHIQYLKSLFDS
jgi:hypothetical protein